MPYNQSLATQIDELVKSKKGRLNDEAGQGFTKKEMFGGVGYMLHGNMCVGVHKDDLIVRFDPKKTDEVMKKKNTRPFDITGRAMKGWLLVSSEGVKGRELNSWFELALEYVKTLPKK